MAIFPNTVVQRCIVHLVRNSLKYKELVLEKETLQTTLTNLETQKPEGTLETVRKFKDYCCDLQKTYSLGNNEIKDEILNAVCWDFSILNGEIASIQYKKPFDMIAKLPKNADFRNWWTVAESAELAFAFGKSRTHFVVLHVRSTKKISDKNVGYFSGGVCLKKSEPILRRTPTNEDGRIFRRRHLRYCPSPVATIYRYTINIDPCS